MPRSPRLPESAVAWELRAAWALGREVALALDRGRPARRGFVEYVAPSGAFIILWDGLGELHVPTALVLAVRSPHFDEPAWGASVAPRPARGPRAALPLPGQLALFEENLSQGLASPR